MAFVNQNLLTFFSPQPRLISLTVDSSTTDFKHTTFFAKTSSQPRQSFNGRLQARNATISMDDIFGITCITEAVLTYEHLGVIYVNQNCLISQGQSLSSIDITFQY